MKTPEPTCWADEVAQQQSVRAAEQINLIIAQYRTRATNAINSVMFNPGDYDITALMLDLMAQEIVTDRHAMTLARRSNLLSGNSYAAICAALDKN